MVTKEYIYEFIKKQKTVFIASVDEDGFPNIKAMFTPRKMEVLQDEEIKKEIWQPGDTIYYKQGVNDPDYCVLKFTAVKGRRYCDLQSESFVLED